MKIHTLIWTVIAIMIFSLLVSCHKESPDIYSGPSDKPVSSTLRSGDLVQELVENPHLISFVSNLINNSDLVDSVDFQQLVSFFEASHVGYDSLTWSQVNDTLRVELGEQLGNFAFTYIYSIMQFSAIAVEQGDYNADTSIFRQSMQEAIGIISDSISIAASPCPFPPCGTMDACCSEATIEYNNCIKIADLNAAWNTAWFAMEAAAAALIVGLTSVGSGGTVAPAGAWFAAGFLSGSAAAKYQTWLNARKSCALQFEFDKQACGGCNYSMDPK